MGTADECNPIGTEIPGTPQRLAIVVWRMFGPSAGDWPEGMLTHGLLKGGAVVGVHGHAITSTSPKASASDARTAARTRSARGTKRAGASMPASSTALVGRISVAMTWAAGALASAISRPS